MKLTTTLKLLRENGAGISGYNRLVCSLKGTKDVYKGTYIEFEHENEINLLYILDSNGISDFHWALKSTIQDSSKVARLLAVAYAREVQHLMKDEQSIRVLDVAERYANGEATVDELRAAWEAAWEAAKDAEDAARDASWYAALAARSDAQTAAQTAAQAAALDAAWFAAQAAAWVAQANAQAAAQAAAWNAAQSVRTTQAVQDILTAFQEKQKEIIKSFLSES